MRSEKTLHMTELKNTRPLAMLHVILLIRVEHCLETVSFYLGLGLLLNSFKSNQFFPLLCLIHCIVSSGFTFFFAYCC